MPTAQTLSENRTFYHNIIYEKTIWLGPRIIKVGERPNWSQDILKCKHWGVEKQEV